MAPLASHLTVGQVADFYGVPTWRIRRIVDSLETPIPRAGLYRMIPREVLGKIGEKVAAATGAAKLQADRQRSKITPPQSREGDE